jgi:dihydroorotate dehydrogenase
MFTFNALKRAASPSINRLGFKRCFSSKKALVPLQSKIIPLPSTTFLLACAIGLGIWSLDARSAINEYVWCPLIRFFTTAEQGHNIGIDVLRTGLYPRLFSDIDDPVLKVNVFGKTLSNPIGMAAGFDKHGQVMDPLFNLGFGYVEIGSVTPLPQPGNPTPRFFRLSKDQAVINRYGFNSVGHLEVLAELKKRFAKLHIKHPNATLNSFRDNKFLAINLGKNKTGDEVEDYIKGVQNFGPYADALVINVSSPNTPGLRDLQNESKLTNLLTKVVKERDNLDGTLIDPTRKPPILVKIAPDLTEPEIKSIAQSAKDSKIDGIILSNTTIQRPVDDLITKGAVVQETGGLSGPPLKPIALKAFRILRTYTKNSDLVLVGCGGISSGKDAIEFAKAGATYVEVYTAFAYKGVGLARKIKDEITTELKKEGKTWMEIVGSDDPK